MTLRHRLDADGMAILALTARWVGGARAQPPEDTAPLRSREWALVARSLAAAGARPADLLGWTAAEIAASLGVEPAAGQGLARLASRASVLALEVERLASRGVWVMSTCDAAYPGRLRRRLGDLAPPVLYGSGAVELLDQGGIAIVGARDADPQALTYVKEAAAAVARTGRPVVSGGARGSDAAAMAGAAAAGGVTVGVLAESLERRIRAVDARSLIADARLVLVSPYGADVPFSVANAMGRNRLIYCLADAAVVVAAADGEGETWAGATEALAAGWVPVHVRADTGVPPGNHALVARGAAALPADPAAAGDLPHAGAGPASRGG